jgi:hypothetical protein
MIPTAARHLNDSFLKNWADLLATVPPIPVELEAVIKDIGEVVRVLDGLNRYRFGADPNLMAVWNAAREVFGRDTPWWESRRPDAIVAVMLER